MEEIKIQSKKNSVPIETNIWTYSDKEKLSVIVGGSGDDKDTFNNLVNALQIKGLEHSVATFTFRGIKNESLNSLNQQVEDLKDVLNYFVKEKGFEDFTITCTSMGAYSASFLIVDPELKNYISSAIYIDPADYYLKDGDSSEGSYAWTGFAEYKPESETASDQLKKIDSNVKVHVINFTLRNRGKDGYAPPERRGEDNPKLFARLNNDMVKTFYKNTREDEAMDAEEMEAMTRENIEKVV